MPLTLLRMTFAARSRPVPRLASRRRHELERLLAIFDQGLVKGNGRGDAAPNTPTEPPPPRGAFAAATGPPRSRTRASWHAIR